MSIGPSLPPHLQHLRAKPDDDEDSSSDDGGVGPALPPPAASSAGEKGIKGESESSDDDDYGPALPPHLLNSKESESRTGASAPQEKESSDDDDDAIGPRVPNAAEDAASMAGRYAKEFEDRARKMKNKIEGKDKEEMKRETWMLELPSDKAKSFGLGPRTFSRKGVTQTGDRSCWTDTPEEKERKARGETVEEDQDAEAEQLNNILVEKRDEAMEKVANELKNKRGSDSLLDMHEKKLKKKKKELEKEGKGQERRPFDRDLDLQVNKFDNAQKKLMMKKAALLDSRFSSGSQKFL